MESQAKAQSQECEQLKDATFRKYHERKQIYRSGNAMNTPFGGMWLIGNNGGVRSPGYGGDLGGSGSGGNGSGGAGSIMSGSCLPGYSDLPRATCDLCPCVRKPPVFPGTCISSDSLVLLEDGSEVRLGSIKVGDNIFGIDCNGKRSLQSVSSFRTFDSECLEVSFGEKKIICTHSHAFITPSIEELFASQAKVGDSVLGDDGLVLQIVSVEPVGVREVVALSVTPNHMFYAGGVTHHNKLCEDEPAIPDP